MAAGRNDKAYLVGTARQLAERLLFSDHRSIFRVRRPGRASRPWTDGWRTVIGDLGKNQPRMELWFDRFSGFTERKFFACFFSENRAKLTAVTKRVSRQLWPVRTITVDDTGDGRFFALAARLKSRELAKPILEKYTDETYFGIYDPTFRVSAATTTRFCNRAAAFFIQVAESLPRANGRTIERRDYPRCENRKWVKAHLRRERSGYLAVQCKERDHYCCHVCTKTFAEVYGRELGDYFAEAHHIRPLGELGDNVRTVIDDLVTVCANCHRMLHRMKGKSGDVERLRIIVCDRKKKR